MVRTCIRHIIQLINDKKISIYSFNFALYYFLKGWEHRSVLFDKTEV